MVGLEWWGWPRNLISRIAHRTFFLNEEERTRFVERLWRVAHFSCVDVLAYCIMSNHFHLLIYIPEPGELKDGEIRERICTLFRFTAEGCPEGVGRCR